MAACVFDIEFTAEKSVVYEKAKKTVESQGGTFEGSEDHGAFNISLMGYTVVGSYTVSGNVLSVIIDEKPMLFPCSAIESFLSSKLN